MKTEKQFKNRFNNLNMDANWEKRQQTGKILAGFFIIIAGFLILLKQMGTEIPHWILSWEMILIVIGVITLIKHNFKKTSGYVLILIGATFMLHDLLPDYINPKLLWPILIIFVGVSMILKSLFKDKKKQAFLNDLNADSALNDEDYVNVSAVLGGATNIVVSKNLKGMSITSVMGGADINLAQADFEKEATIDVICFMGGVTMVVPSNWKVISDLTTVLGGVDDKRSPDNLDLILEPKTLYIKGTCVMGGIELDSYDKSDSKNW
jgi:predicted membrane protein